MSQKDYPLHPGQTMPQPYYCTIPLEEYESLKKAHRWRKVDDDFPTADEGYFWALWEDGVPDVGYIGAEDDVIETLRDRGEGHSIELWMPITKAPEVR